MWKIAFVVGFIYLVRTDAELATYWSTCLERCPTNTTAYAVAPDCRSCAKYVVCVMGYTLRLRCKNGHQYDTPTHSCVAKGHGTCGNRRTTPQEGNVTASTSPVTPAATLPRPVVCKMACESFEFGAFQSCRGCHYYLVCRGRTSEQRYCPPGTTFHFGHGSCQPGDEGYPCNLPVG